MSEAPILVVEDDEALRNALAETLELAGHTARVAADGSAAMKIIEAEAIAAVVTDFQMAPMDGHALLQRIRARQPDLPVLMMTAHGTIQRAVRAMRDGANDYLVKPFEVTELIERLERLTAVPACAPGMVAEDPVTMEVLGLASRVASSDATVLLSGESGTGKEVFARYIHARSRRAEGPFIAINCAAIPENMLEAVLFGHEKGAFTGAHTARTGKFEQAQGGTLLLDEVSEMDLGLQAKLLRVLQEREVERVGGATSIALDVRVLATTNRDLKHCVSAGDFREDLFYRLSVFPLELPPLRRRPGDIQPLARYFLAAAGAERQPLPQFSMEAARTLEAYHWPGNVRELANVVQRALILCTGETIRPGELRFESVPTREDEAEEGSGRLQDGLRSREERMIAQALAQGGSRKRAAELLGISPRTLRYKIARLREQGCGLPGPGSRG